MQDIDFLPVEYRQEHARRQLQPWRIVVVAAFAALLAAAAFSQYNCKQRVKQELAAILPQYEQAVSQNAKLAELQSRLQTARTYAELYTYLRHPWPRTQLLATLLAPLPEEITLGQLQIIREKPQDQTPTERRSRSERKIEQEEDETLPPAVRDLKRLRDECDEMETLVLISGTTSESGMLHRYLGELNDSELFSIAELESSESAGVGPDSTEQFRARLLVRPGYGQPGGPTGPGKKAPLRKSTDRQTGKRPYEDQRPPG